MLTTNYIQSKTAGNGAEKRKVSIIKAFRI